ncbi:MAG: tRNA epoxyqueuosine(34) reductase QueG [Pseudomonadota bacterium]
MFDANQLKDKPGTDTPDSDTWSSDIGDSDTGDFDTGNFGTSNDVARKGPTDVIKDLAIDAGFDAVRITHPDAIPDAPQQLSRFVALDRHGEMHWMAERQEERGSPSALWPEVKSVIMLGQNYGPDDNPLEHLKYPERGGISVYARGKDYHDIIKKRLKKLARLMIERFGGDVKVFVDTAPVMEKPLAAAAGLGWQGKHTNLVSREFGSWLFLGSIFTTLRLETDTPETDHCGGCTACLDACPTEAFPAPYQLDARRCVSYLTIEYKGAIPLEFRQAIGNRIYGCDDCLSVCPWNKFASQAHEIKLHANPKFKDPPLAALAQLDDTAFRAFFSGSPMKRTGRDRFIRNVMIAIGNSGDRSLLKTALDRLKDNSSLVRGAAVWATRRLTTKNEASALMSEYFDEEMDQNVKNEWTQPI